VVIHKTFSPALAASRSPSTPQAFNRPLPRPRLVVAAALGSNEPRVLGEQ